MQLKQKSIPVKSNFGFVFFQEKIDGKLKTNNNILIKINKKERYPTVEKINCSIDNNN